MSSCPRPAIRCPALCHSTSTNFETRPTSKQKMKLNFPSAISFIHSGSFSFKWTAVNPNSVSSSFGSSTATMLFMYQSNRGFNIPPGQPPGHLNFLDNFCSNSPLPEPKSCSNAPILGKITRLLF